MMDILLKKLESKNLHALHWIKKNCARLFITFVVATLIRCESDDQKGERLAKTYCGSCHAFTRPEMLDKTTWQKFVLPEMAFRMGLPSLVIGKKNFDDLQAVLPTIPKQPMVSKTDYELITNYFLSLAPDSLPAPNGVEPAPLTQFDATRISLGADLPMVTLLKADSNGTIFVGSRDKSLLRLQDHFLVKEKYLLDSPPSYLLSHGNTITCLEMGVMDPNDKAAGKLVEFSLSTSDKKTIIDSLKRPAYFEKVDLNGDRLDDYVVCE